MNAYESYAQPLLVEDDRTESHTTFRDKTFMNQNITRLPGIVSPQFSPYDFHDQFNISILEVAIKLPY